MIDFFLLTFQNLFCAILWFIFGDTLQHFRILILWTPCNILWFRTKMLSRWWEMSTVTCASAKNRNGWKISSRGLIHTNLLWDYLIQLLVFLYKTVGRKPKMTSSRDCWLPAHTWTWPALCPGAPRGSDDTCSWKATSKCARALPQKLMFTVFYLLICCWYVKQYLRKGNELKWYGSRT